MRQGRDGATEALDTRLPPCFLGARGKGADAATGGGKTRL